MNPEIIEWYKANGYSVSDFYDAKRHGGIKLSRAQVTAGIVSYYEKVRDGMIKPKRISIGWGIPQEARVARFGDYVSDNEIIETHKPVIAGLRARIEIIKERVYTWKLCFWVILGVSVFLGLAYIDIKWGLPL